MELYRGGLKVIASINVPDYETVKRTWRERLFTLPWRPFKSTKSVYKPIAYIFNNVVLVSYFTYTKLHDEMATRRSKGLDRPGSSEMT